jgi:hypothetical protein
MYLEIWLLIGLHGNQQSMCQSLSLLLVPVDFVPLLFLVSLCFCVSYLAYPTWPGKKAVMMMLLLHFPCLT